MQKKTIVISAVNLVEAGTLTILRECLQSLSELNVRNEYRIVALVFDKNLAHYPNIEYIETQWPKKRWVNRLWFEYISMKKISQQLSPVFLWFSLHDTSPSVIANRRVVYCHNSYSFYKWKLHDLIFAPKIALFAIFTKYIYKTNIHKNHYIVVQQEWFRKAMSHMFDIDPAKIIVAFPNRDFPASKKVATMTRKYSFLFAGSPNSHKNFEVICRAAALLESEGRVEFEVFLTVKGNENKYAKWLHQKWGSVKSIHFIGFITKEQLVAQYSNSNCLIFPSKVESWGLPISEFAEYNKPMILADLPYAHETSAGANLVTYFDPNSPEDLANKMRKLIQGDLSEMQQQNLIAYSEPKAENWRELFNILLEDKIKV